MRRYDNTETEITETSQDGSVIKTKTNRLHDSSDSGIRDVLIALLGFGVVGFLLCVLYAIAVRFTSPNFQLPYRTRLQSNECQSYNRDVEFVK